MNSEDIIANIKSIYARFPIPQNLQEHHFRVVSVGRLIADHWNGPAINNNDLVAYLLLHDVGNIVKFDFSQKDMYRDDITLYIHGWKKRQEETIKKYGSQDQDVTLAFARALAVPPRIIQLLQHTDLLFMNDLVHSSDWENKLGKYADLRVGPHGVLTLKERFDDLQKRYAGRKFMQDPRLPSALQATFVIEKQVLSNTDLAPGDITDNTIKKYYEHYV